MRVEIDQSGRFEYTQQDTVLAFANGLSHSILISARTKRACIEKMRTKGIKPPRLQALLFSTALFLMLRNHSRQISLITIDREYYGNERVIKGHLVNLFERAGTPIDPDIIRFDLIGRRSPAHQVAIETFRGKRKPNRVVSDAELLAEL
jgi:hypothetical protein